MRHHPLFLVSSVLLLIIVILHGAAVMYYFYYLYWWYDIVMHFLGGLWVSISTLWFFLVSEYAVNFKSVQRFFSTYPRAFIFSLCAVLTVGIAWELFELVFGISFTLENYVIDTILDLVMDGIGGIVGFLFVQRRDKFSVFTKISHTQ
jgi:hypothetical protein